MGLEESLNISDQVNDLISLYSAYSPRRHSIISAELRDLKGFSHKKKMEIREIVRGSSLDSSDCLTKAVIIHLIGLRIGVMTRLARPENFSRYCHGMLTYDHEGKTQIFKVTGSSKFYPPVILTDSQVLRRINYVRPVFNLVNKLKGRY